MQVLFFSEKEEKRKKVNQQKAMLLQQIEERQAKKQREKSQRLQEEIEEEERIKREIEMLNARDQDEADMKNNKQKKFRNELDQQSEQQNQSHQNNRRNQDPPTPVSNQHQDIPPEFQELASSVGQQQQKKVNFDQFPSEYPTIPEGQDMFKASEFKGTNTQRLNEIQLKFQNEVGQLKSEISNKHNEIYTLVSQLKDAQEALKSKENTDSEVQKLRAELKNRETEERTQQAMLQQQLMDLMKGYQQQVSYFTKGNDDHPPTDFQRPGSNRMIGRNKTDSRSSELKNFEKMLFGGQGPTSNISKDPSSVMIDINNPSSKPYVKGSSGNNPQFDIDEYNKQRMLELSKSASLNAESKMVPFNAHNISTSGSKIPKYQNLEGTGELNTTNGSVGRRMNRELDEIERMNMDNAEEFPGSLRGTRMLEQIPEEDNESLRNTSNFEEMKTKQNENNNPNKSLDNSSTFRLNQTSLSDPKMKTDSMKIEKFDGFPEIPEYEGIQDRYMNMMKNKDPEQEEINNRYEDPLEGTTGTAKSIDFDELQKKLTQKTQVTPAQAQPEQQEQRKKWGDIKPKSKPKQKPVYEEDNLDTLQKEMEGIDQLLDQFTPQEAENTKYQSQGRSDNVPVYETEPDNFNKGKSNINADDMAYDRFRPSMDSIMETSNEYTMSKGNDLLSNSERKLIQDELGRHRRADN